MAITTKLYSKVWEGLTVKLAGTVDKEVLTQKPVLVRGVRYIDKPYRLSIYRHILKISISIRSLLKISISISISIKTFIEISISIRTFLKISISISISIRSF